MNQLKSSIMAIRVRLKEWRDKRGLSQAELAKLARVRQPTISDIETGKMTDPGVATLGKLAKALRVRVSTLVEEQ